MKQIEKTVIKKRSNLIKRGQKVFALAIREQYNSALDAVNKYGLGQINEHLESAIKIDPMQHAFDLMYGQATDIGLTWRKHLMGEKDELSDQVYQNYFERKMSEFVRSNAGKRIVDITGTTLDQIRNVVESATLRATEEGLSIQGTRDLIIQFIADDYKSFTKARAELIARTEMNTAANFATQQAGKSTGLETRKFWSTSGLPHVRDSHMAAEQESIDRGGLRDDETFNSVGGMAYPGDMSGSPENVINCRCSLLIEIV